MLYHSGRIVVHGLNALDQVPVMGTSDKKQEAEAERARQLRLVEALMEPGVSFADPCHPDAQRQRRITQDVM